MLDYYFYEFGGEVMLDEVINTNGERTLLKFRFEIVGKSEGITQFKTTKESYIKLMKR